MLLLVSTSDKIQLITASAVSTIDCHASYVDYDGATTITPGRKNTAVSTNTTTDIVAAPGSSVSRNVKNLSIRNAHASSSNLLTIQHTDGATVITLFKYTLLAGEEIVFAEGVGWQVLDSSGNLKTIQTTGTLVKVTQVTASGAGSWTPDAKCSVAFVECIGGGGQGGGAATSSATSSVGGGGGGGAYAASRLTGTAIKVTSYSVGAKGSAGAAGATGSTGSDTTWDTTVIVAKGGVGGAVLAAATTFLAQIGGAGGASGSCTGDIKISGGLGDKGIRLSGTQAWSGNGGSSAWLGATGADGVVAITGGTAGVAAATGAYGAGGSGAATLTTTQAGGAGQDGMIVIYEYD